MKTNPRILGATMALLLVGALVVEIRAIQQRQVEIAALQNERQQFNAESADLRQQRATAAAELKQAETQLGAIPAPRDFTAALRPEQRADIEAWLARAQTLRAYFAAKPEQRIPEMQLLKSDDWLMIAKTYPVDSEERIRRAAAALRSAAINVFASRISAAMRRYTAGTTEPPASVHALVPYFDGPVDPAMLERYEIVARMTTAGSRAPTPTWGVVNKAPVDLDYDDRFQLGASGGGTIGGGLARWMPGLGARQREAARRFREQNPGATARSITDILPYFDPPLDPAIAERLKKAEAPR